MFFESNFNIRLNNIGCSTTLTNYGFLSLLEEVAQMHSASAHLGIHDIKTSGYTWVLINWKVKIFNRPKYGDTIHIQTWARYTNKFYTYRDFKIYDSNNNLIAIATSKWALIDVHKKSLARITDEILDRYKPEAESVFDEIEVPKLKEPESYSQEKILTVKKTDIDINKHVHNLNYLNYAYEALPDEFVFNEELNNFEILFKKQIQYGDIINALYKFDGSSHIITLKTNNKSTLNAIIKLY